MDDNNSVTTTEESDEAFLARMSGPCSPALRWSACTIAIKDLRRLISLAEKAEKPWVPWAGGDMPVSGDSVVRIKMRYGFEEVSAARDFNWIHDEASWDIVAYQITAKAP